MQRGQGDLVRQRSWGRRMGSCRRRMRARDREAGELGPGGVQVALEGDNDLGNGSDVEGEGRNGGLQG